MARQNTTLAAPSFSNNSSIQSFSHSTDVCGALGAGPAWCETVSPTVVSPPVHLLLLLTDCGPPLTALSSPAPVPTARVTYGPHPGPRCTHLSRAWVPMASACVEILPHMDRTMALSALVRDMVVAELERGVLRTGHSARPPGALYTHAELGWGPGCGGVGLERGEGCGVGSLIRPSEDGWSPVPGGLVG